MKKVLVFLLVLFANLVVQAQNFNKIVDAPGITFYGLDFTYAKMSNPQDFPPEVELVSRYIHSEWNDLIIKEKDKYDVGRPLKKEAELYFDVTNNRNKSIIPGGIIIDREYHFSEEDAAKILQEYPSRSSANVGLVYLVEYFSKPKDKGYIWTIYFNQQTKEIYLIERVDARPGGAGIRNYWVRTVLSCIELTYDKYKGFVRGNYEIRKDRYPATEPAIANMTGEMPQMVAKPEPETKSRITQPKPSAQWISNPTATINPNTQNIKAILDAPEITWYGLDFSLAKMAGEADFPTEEELVNKYIHYQWNQLLMDEQEKYNVGKPFRKKVEYYFDVVNSKNQSIVPGDIISDLEYHFSKQDAANVLATLPTRNSPNVGLIYVVEHFNKPLEIGHIWTIYFNQNTREVYHMELVESRPSGGGIRNFWARCVLETIEGSYENYKRWSKGDYIASESKHPYTQAAVPNKTSGSGVSVSAAAIASAPATVATAQPNAPKTNNQTAKKTQTNQEQIMTIPATKDHTPPQIMVTEPPNIRNNMHRSSEDLMPIKGTVIDDTGVKGLKVNGYNTPVKPNGSFVINLTLAPGENPVIIEAMDYEGNLATKQFTVLRHDQNTTASGLPIGKNYILAVSIDNYKYWPKLNNAVRDAKDVVDVLTEMYNFESQDVIFLQNEQASKENIYKELRNLISNVTPNDNVLIYYSGHGHFDNLMSEGFWVPYEAREKVESDYLSNSSIMKIIQSIDSRHTFLVVDACFSGSLFAGASRGYIENVEQYKSRWALASGRLETVSDGTQGKNSPFANYFIKCLRDNPNDKMIVSEVVQYVKVNVSEVSNQTPLGNPLKNVGDEGGEFVFYKRK